MPPSFATAEAAGKRRAEQVLEKLLAHPLLDGGQVLNEADSLLVSIVGGPDLKMSEIQKLMEPLSGRARTPTSFWGRPLTRNLPAASPSRSSPPAIVKRGYPTTAPLPPRETLAGASAPLEFSSPRKRRGPSPVLSRRRRRYRKRKRQQLLKGQGGRSRRRISRLQKELPVGHGVQRAFREKASRPSATARTWTCRPTSARACH